MVGKYAWSWLDSLEPVDDDFVKAVEDGRRQYIDRRFAPLLVGASAPGPGELPNVAPVIRTEPELGWLLLNGREGNGYAFEAATAAKAYAIGVRKVPSLVSYIEPQNASSQRLAERLGGRLDAEAATPNGDPCLV